MYSTVEGWLAILFNILLSLYTSVSKLSLIATPSLVNCFLCLRSCSVCVLDLYGTW